MRKLLLEFAGTLVESIRTMLAPALAAIASLEVILLGKNDVSLF